MSDPEVARTVGEHFGPGATGAFRGQNGMVSSVSAHATLAGVDILKQGGNAVDAAVAVQFVLMVAEPYGSGLGGGLFAVGYDAGSGEVYTVDGREEAPVSFHADRFLDETGEPVPFEQRITGGDAVGVPGTLAACALLLADHGTLPLETVLQPAIRLAREGVPVDAIFAANVLAHWDRLKHFPEAVRLFSRPDGSPLQAGDRHANPDLAATLEMIASHGPDFFYRGPLAEEIVTTVRNASVRPGILSVKDLANYRAVRREPVRTPFAGYEVVGMNMPSSGGVSVAMMLNLIAKTNYTSHAPFSAEDLQLRFDIQNIVFADRNHFMGDADFVAVPVAGLLDPSYAKERVSAIRSSEALQPPLAPGTPPGLKQLPDERSGGPRSESSSTTHFTVVDRDRNVISVTSTIEQHFGSALPVPGRGFLLNNELTDFDELAYSADGRARANAAEGGHQQRRTALGEARHSSGGKRPRSSMAPTLVLREGEPFLALGSPGRSPIIVITFNVLLNVLVHKMELQSAINAPRAIARNGPPELETPLFRDTELRQSLMDRGLDTADMQAVGAVQAVLIDDDGWLYGSADPRREGFSFGF